MQYLSGYLVLSMRIPRTLDRPTRLLGVPFDLVMVCMATYYVAMMFECGMVGIPISIGFAYIYSRFRTRSLFRNLQRFVYWYFPAEFTKKTGVLSHMRRIKLREEK